jgi:SAM-dependent methyltransferase
MNSELLQEAHYDQIGEAYDSHYGDPFSNKYRVRFFYEPMFEGVKLSGMNVLEAMCGNGQTVEYLIEQGSKVTGLDISAVAINAFRLRWPDCNAVCGSMLDSGFEDESFDCVTIVGGLHHIHPNLNEAIREIHRILKPGGYFCFTEPHTGSAADAIRQVWYRYDKLFAANEAAVDVNELKNEFSSQFKFTKETYMGNIAYLLVFNSMVFRIPVRLKFVYSDILMRIESLINYLPGKLLSCFVVVQWQKK